MKTLFNRVALFLKSSVLDPSTSNPSSKKVSAYAVLFLIFLVHIVWVVKSFKTGDFSLLPQILWADLGFVVAALGISAWQTNKYQNSSSANSANGSGSGNSTSDNSIKADV